MPDLFWYFLLYSFLGFLLEVAFSQVTHAAKRDRKCHLLLPLCPVYGLGALAILMLPASVQQRPLLLFFLGGFVTTAVEFLTGLFYEKLIGVRFWDYSELPGNLGGKVCLLFSGFWGLLSLGLAYGVQPLMVRFVSYIPYGLGLPVAMFFALDAIYSLYLLRRAGDTDVLKWYDWPPAPARRRS